MYGLILFGLAGVVVLLIQAVIVLKNNGIWENFYFTDMMPAAYVAWIHDVPWIGLKSSLLYLTEQPLAVLFFGAAILCYGFSFFVFKPIVDKKKREEKKETKCQNCGMYVSADKYNAHRQSCRYTFETPFSLK